MSPALDLWTPDGNVEGQTSLPPSARPPSELPGLDDYIAQGCVPGGTQRNFDALKSSLPTLTPRELAVLCDPQTSGGLLMAASPDALGDVQELLIKEALPSVVLGSLTPNESGESVIRLQAG